jgi:chromosome segregation ATPase
MGVFSSKIIVGVIAGGFSLGGAGLLFTGGQQLEDASNFVNEAKGKIVQYEVSENSLLSKLGLVQTEANGKIQDANNVITSKNTQLAEQLQEINRLTDHADMLQGQVHELKGTIDDLRADLSTSNTNLEATRQQLTEKTAAYDAKVQELQRANDTINEYIRLAQIAYAKAQEADSHIVELEAEVQEANAAVDAHDVVVDQAQAETQDKAPMTTDELNNVDTSTEEVVETPAE